ncbi:hypothetical protein LV779_27190 [Streptomyces thinghirensis]|nr:hypothetical protein [Streptomyces thinghirensis]
MAARRHLTDGPLLALASAKTVARVTVVVTAGEVTVSVVADAAAPAAPHAIRFAGTSVLFDEKENLLWLESPMARTATAFHVGIVDDHPVVIDGVRAWLAEAPGIRGQTHRRHHGGPALRRGGRPDRGPQPQRSTGAVGHR